MGEVITFKITAERKKELKQLSEQSGIQMGSLVRKAIYQMLDAELKK